MTSPTQRSLKYLRDNGWEPEVVEKYNSFARIRIDLFGFLDILAVKGDVTLGVQTTSYSNMSARRTKILESENYKKLKQANWKIHVHGWKKKKNGRYELKQYEL